MPLFNPAYHCPIYYYDVFAVASIDFITCSDGKAHRLRLYNNLNSSHRQYIQRQYCFMHIIKQQKCSLKLNTGSFQLPLKRIGKGSIRTSYDISEMGALRKSLENQRRGTLCDVISTHQLQGELPNRQQELTNAGRNHRAEKFRDNRRLGRHERPW